MHIYAFGSLCRGEISLGSDVDLLAITEGHDPRFDPEMFSIYSYRRIDELWQQGNPFAWHLSFEGRLVFAENNDDVLKVRGRPRPYRDCVRDCGKFQALFADA